jgi:hypothetical protein
LLDEAPEGLLDEAPEGLLDEAPEGWLDEDRIDCARGSTDSGRSTRGG